ncbi:MAG: type I-F CRISPR-associated endoribonuclease Cas6/Csy4 [Rickettsiales bacterium]|nr:type I-F CRISPR-associated endoribonuclease Cas6/Csy4 [Rickettsiales bacterium]
MKNYIEITLLDEAEINSFDLWSKLLTQIHLGLTSIKEIEQDGKEKSPIGISFPEYFMGKKFGVLGSKLRLFAKNESDLQKFDSAKWLSRLSDYIHVSNIREVPQKIDGYAIYNRYQPKVNKDRIIRRHQKREEEWKNIISNPNSDSKEITAAQEKLNKRQQRTNNYDKEKPVNEPFIKLKSLNSNKEFCLWIKKTTATQANYQKFSTYGLSNYDKEKIDDKNYSTVPEF